MPTRQSHFPTLLLVSWMLFSTTAVVASSTSSDNNLQVEDIVINLSAEPVGSRYLTEVPYLDPQTTNDKSNYLRGSIESLESNSTEISNEIIDSRIVGGIPAEDGSYPFMAAAIYRHRYFSCGASLVASNVVLLAAHCANSVHGILIGRYNLGRYSANEEYFVIAEKLVHPSFVWGNPPKYDYVLMKFRGTSKHKPVKLDDDTLTNMLQTDNEEAIILGWGQTASSQAAQTMALQEGKLNLMSNESCRNQWWGSYIESNMLCAYRNGVSGCMGDSGGPLFHTNDDNSHTLLGVVSWGSGRCNYATVFSNIADQSDWIIQNVNAWSNGEACHNYKSLDKCSTDPECIWKTPTNECISASS